MVRKCGILHRRASDRYHEAIAIYSDLHHPDADIPRNFRRAHSIAGDGGIPIRMIGVWDTVGALGIPVRGLAAEEKAQPDEKSTLADPSQHLHESVYKRWDDDPEYRPKNLRAYFARVSDPRAAQP